VIGRTRLAIRATQGGGERVGLGGGLDAHRQLDRLPDADGLGAVAGDHCGVAVSRSRFTLAKLASLLVQRPASAFVILLLCTKRHPAGSGLSEFAGNEVHALLRAEAIRAIPTSVSKARNPTSSHPVTGMLKKPGRSASVEVRNDLPRTIAVAR
jgi:hypothetical protein